MKVAIVAMGEMGAAIGERLVRHGAEVATSLAGRSAASAGRARKAGIAAAADDASLLDGADVFLSVAPPAEAVNIARRFAPALRGSRAVYVDCNAVAPGTARTIAGIVSGTGAGFVDIGIIGGPPRGDAPGPRLYASGDALDRVRGLASFGLDVRAVEGEVGAASALKMAYASLTKGLTALGVMMADEAEAGGVTQALRAELADSQPQLLAWLSRQVPSMYPKAYRWVGEMQEIASFLGEHPGAQAFRGIAELYERIARSREAGETAQPDLFK